MYPLSIKKLEWVETGYGFIFSMFPKAANLN